MVGAAGFNYSRGGGLYEKYGISGKKGSFYGKGG